MIFLLRTKEPNIETEENGLEYFKQPASSTLIKILIAFLLVSKGQASLSVEPEEIVKKIFQLAKDKELKSSKKQQLKIEEMFNFKVMSNDILGKNSLKQSPKEVDWFHQTIKGIITKTIYPKAPNFLNEVKIEYKNIEKNNYRATVYSIVKSKGEETEVDYNLKLINNNWKVVNVIIDDESWVENISEKVETVIKKKKWKGLKKLLTKKLKELKK
tara:strand:+ start:34292 stop:34936 length:645 start_codon:yes stop_codon:yes gene_type:complete